MRPRTESPAWKAAGTLLTVVFLTGKRIHVPRRVGRTPTAGQNRRQVPWAYLTRPLPSNTCPLAQLPAPLPGPTCSAGWIFWADNPESRQCLLRRPASQDHPAWPQATGRGFPSFHPGPGKTDLPADGGVATGRWHLVILAGAEAAHLEWTSWQGGEWGVFLEALLCPGTN